MNNNSTQYDNQTTQSNILPKQRKVALYAHVSPAEQAKAGFRIGTQLASLRKMCQQNGYKIYCEYADSGIDGENIKGRPALIELLNDANENKFDLVLVWKMNRISWEIQDLLTIVEMLKAKNIGFRSYTELYETETPSGMLQFQILAAIVEHEQVNSGENEKWKESE